MNENNTDRERKKPKQKSQLDGKNLGNKNQVSRVEKEFVKIGSHLV